MPLDPSIALQGQQFDPVGAYGKAAQLSSLLGQQRLQGLQINQAERQQREEQTLADLYKGNINQDGTVNRQGVLSGAAQQGLGARVPALQKGFADQDEALLKVQELRGKIGDQKFKALHDSTQVIGDAAAALSSDPNRQVGENDVYSMMGDLVRRGVFDTAAGLHGTTPDEFARQQLQGMPVGNQQALRQWLQDVARRNVGASKLFEAALPKFQQIDAGNRVITGTVAPMTGQFTPQGAPITKAPEGFVVGQDGSLTADPGFVRGKSQIAAAGRPVTNVNVNTTKSLLNTAAEGLGKQLDESLAGAQTAQQTIGVTQRLQGLLNSGNLITGPGADARLVVNQIANGLGVGGADDAEKLANTRQVMQQLATLELQAGQAMKGQGAITENERAILRNAAAGQINMSVPELKALTQTLEDRAYKRIEAHQGQVQRLGAIPEAKTLMPFYSVEAPPRAAVVAPAQDWKGAGYASKAQAVQDALGAIQRGADKTAVIQRLEAAGITNHGIK